MGQALSRCANAPGDGGNQRGCSWRLARGNLRPYLDKRGLWTRRRRTRTLGAVARDLTASVVIDGSDFDCSANLGAASKSQNHQATDSD